MKKLFLCLAFFSAGVGLFAADSIRFTEKLVDKLVTVTDSSEVQTTISGTFNATITFPGLGAAVLNENTELAFSIGDLEFSALGGQADVRGSQSVTFIQTVEIEKDNGDIALRPVGQVTFSRKGDVLTIVAQSSDLDGSSIAADDHAGDSGSILGQIEAHIQVGEFETTRNVYYRGVGSVTQKTVGHGDDAEEFDLNSVMLVGETDTIAPTVSITIPKPNQRWSNDVFTVQGKAGDNYGVESVALTINGEEFGEVELENGSWQQEISLVPGTNIIQAQSFDLEGTPSAIATVKMIYVLTDRLNLTVDAGGKVTGVSNQQLLEIGKKYTATATASNTFLFSGWVGDVVSTNPVLSFTMASNLSLHATFIPNPFLPLKGVYNGLFFPGNSNSLRTNITTDLVTASNAGFFTLTLSDRGSISSGKFLFGGASIPFPTAQFDLSGHAHFIVVRPGPIPDLITDLQLDFQNGTKTITGTVHSTDAAFTAEILGDLAGGAAFFAKYTFLIPGGSADNTNAPAGDGAGTLGVNNTGLLTLAGSLGEGTPISQSTSLSGSGDWPLYVPLQGGRGLLIGWGSFVTSSPAFHVVGHHWRWIKAPATIPAEKFYRAGFHEEKELLGARYLTPPVGANPLGWTNGLVLIDGGNLPGTISNQVAVASQITVLANSNNVAVTMVPASGLVTGTFKSAALGKNIPAPKGAAIQLPPASGGTFIGGWFLGTNQSGYLRLQRNP